MSVVCSRIREAVRLYLYLSRHSAGLYKLSSNEENVDDITLEEQNDKVTKLDSALINQMEQMFGTDLKDVEIHTGAFASELTSSNNAEAVTIGNKIYFADGQYSPQNREGMELLAHELLHIIQFKNQERMTYKEDIEALEYEADKLEDTLDSAVTTQVHVENKNGVSSASTALFKQINSGETGENLSDFSGQDRELKYILPLDNGKTIQATERELQVIYSQIADKLLEWISEESVKTTQEEYREVVLKFLKWVG